MVSCIDILPAQADHFARAIGEVLRQYEDIDIRTHGAKHEGFPISFGADWQPFLNCRIGLHEERIIVAADSLVLSTVEKAMRQHRPGGGRAFLTKVGVWTVVDQSEKQILSWSWPGDSPTRRIQALLF